MTTFVLVHGASHGAWCWYKIVPRLERLGHTVLVPDVQGHGLDRTPPGNTSLAGMVDGICRLIDAQKEPVVLVGHSFGGIVITQAGEERPEKIRELVYLAAVLVPNGGTATGIGPVDKDSVIAAAIRTSIDGKSITFDAAAIRPGFYEYCSEEDVALARMLLVPEGTAVLAAPVRTTAERWGRIPRVYIECLRDRALTIGSQRLSQQSSSPCRKVFSIDTDHSPFFSRPDELTSILAGL